MPGSADRYASVDFLTDTSIVDDPYPYYRYLREERGPVWIEPTYGVAMVSGLAEAMVAFRDPETFSSCNAPTGPFPGLPEMPDGDEASALIEEHRARMPLYGYMATWDPPEHHAYRSLLTGLFTPRRLKENEAFMWRLADQQLDRVIDRPAEFVEDYAHPFALMVIADLLGVPEGDRARFRAWFRDRKALVDVAGVAERTADADAEGTNVLGFFESTFAAYIEDRRRHPRDDVLTHLAGVTFPDGSTPDITILANEAAFLFAAGQETTARTLAFAMQYLGDDPALETTLREQRGLIPAFTEELLRLESPVKVLYRMARRTTSLGGVEIPAGSSVMLMLGAVNRDPRTFEDPDEVRLDRPNSYEHLALSKGIHACLGQQLARAEIRVSLERIFDRTTAIEIAQEHHGPTDDRRYSYDPTSFFRGLTELHLRLVPDRAELCSD
jgi:cytochrome P450